ncbi:class IV adenylate cyclase [Candidatus Shapirobacteria bacterium]|nr:class IV adenylate cyclase [Candidatus Shapirobacteria bacterium]
MNKFEIEIQVKVKSNKKLVAFLRRRAKFISKSQQIDEYFSPRHNDFLSKRPIKEWLRLRNANGNYSLNYKNWYFNKEGKSFHCDEYETKIDQLDQAKRILLALGFERIVIVDKVRQVWTYNDYEIALDSVKNLGAFVEIEYLGKDKKVNPEKVAEQMVNFLKEVGCEEIMINYVGYPFQLLFPEEVKHEKQ